MASITVKGQQVRVPDGAHEFDLYCHSETRSACVTEDARKGAVCREGAFLLKVCTHLSIKILEHLRIKIIQRVFQNFDCYWNVPDAVEVASDRAFVRGCIARGPTRQSTITGERPRPRLPPHSGENSAKGPFAKNPAKGEIVLGDGPRLLHEYVLILNVPQQSFGELEFTLGHRPLLRLPPTVNCSDTRGEDKEDRGKNDRRHITEREPCRSSALGAYLSI